MCVIILVGVTNVISSFFSVSWTGLMKSNGSLQRRSGLGRNVKSFMAIPKQVCLTDIKPGDKKYIYIDHIVINWSINFHNGTYCIITIVEACFNNTHTHTHTYTTFLFCYSSLFRYGERGEDWDSGKDVFNPQFWFPRPDYLCQESNDTNASKHM